MSPHPRLTPADCIRPHALTYLPRSPLSSQVRLKGSRLWAYVMVLTTSWLPRGICLPYGFGEWWDLVDWRQWAFQESGQVRVWQGCTETTVLM